MTDPLAAAKRLYHAKLKEEEARGRPAPDKKPTRDHITLMLMFSIAESLAEIAKDTDTNP